MITLTQKDGAVLLPVKVVPGASRTRCLGDLDGRVKIAVASPPEGGRANKALCTFLANKLGTRKNAVTVESGRASPIKTIRIEGVQASQIRDALALE
ncbi:MAG: DUF167 domain-containing protein [Phycisphaerae bacterium]